MKLVYAVAILLAAISTALCRDAESVEGKIQIKNNQFVLVTESPVAGRGEFDNTTVSSNRIMLIGYSPEQAAALKNLVGKNVRATGILGQAFTRYHTEPLVLVIKSLPKVIQPRQR